MDGNSHSNCQAMCLKESAHSLTLSKFELY